MDERCPTPNRGELLEAQLSNALVCAGVYDEESRSYYERWFRRYVLTPFGPSSAGGRPAPDGHCDGEFSPVELSLHWQDDVSVVRVRVEPVSPPPCGRPDHYKESAIEGLLRRITRESILTDLALFQHFSQQLCRPWVSHAHARATAISFDLAPCVTCLPVPQAHFYPTAKPLGSHVNSEELVKQAIGEINNAQQYFSLQYCKVLDFVSLIDPPRNLTDRVRPRLAYLTVDCVESCRSSITVYFDGPPMSLDETVEMYTLGGRLRGPTLGGASAALRDLWDLLLNRPMGPGQDRSGLDDRINGIVFGFELRPGATEPRAEVRMPVSRYGSNDAAIATAVESFCARRGWMERASRYTNDLGKIL